MGFLSGLGSLIPSFNFNFSLSQLEGKELGPAGLPGAFDDSDEREERPAEPESAAMPSPNPVSADPLSMHILKRTGTDQLLRRQSTADLESDRPNLLRRPTEPEVKKEAKKDKHVSFLSRLRKHKDDDDVSDDDSDNKTEGFDAAQFSNPAGISQPPKYIRMRAHGSFLKDFDRVFLAQELYRKPAALVGESADVEDTMALPPHKHGAIWSIKFSNDGKYLATGGEDRVVRVWAVIASPEEREQYDNESDSDSSSHSHSHRRRRKRRPRLTTPVFHSAPLREFVGHKGDVLDLSWSKNNFLLSSSMDKTVRLWHVSLQECLCCFQHQDFVASIAFHPLDDRFFLSGSLDCRLRLWSIPDKTVVYWTDLSNYITAVAFSGNGQTAIAGCFSGRCFFYETEGLRYRTCMHVRSSRGRNSKGAKITGIEVLQHAPDAFSSDAILLITSNDSRVRLYNFKDKSLEVKLKGNENTFSQIRATASEDGKYVISGSEDNKVYIWNMTRKDKQPYEYFTETVTEAIFAPTKTIQVLAQSGDPLYDLCADEVHSNGNIIVTADQVGRIKIFRQDCTYDERERLVHDRPERVGQQRSQSDKSVRSSSLRSLRSVSAASSIRTPLSRIRSQSVRPDASSPASTPPRSSRSSRSLSRLGRSKTREATPTQSPPPSELISPAQTTQSAYSMTGFFDNLSDGDFDNHSVGDELECKRCGSANFKATITARHETRLVCANCGMVMK